jgi:hypothetical protein
LIVLSVVYLGLTIRVFLLEADMSLGLSRISGPGLAGLIVNRQEYTPPVDSIIRMSQATMFLNVVEVLDSLDGDGNRKDLRRTAFAEILNRYTTSLTEYRWVRSVCVSAMRRQPSSRMGRADSVNMQRLRMFVPRFREYPSFFRDTLDREAL